MEKTKELSLKRNYLYTLLSNYIGMGVTIIINLISIPISLSYWKAEKFGIWALITSLLAYLGVSNLGLNSAASVLMAKNPLTRDKLVILKKAFIVMLFSVFIGCIFFIYLNYFSKNWVSILGKIPPYYKTETRLSCYILGLFFFINMPFSLTTSILVGFQKAYIENTFTIFLTLTNFVSLLLVVFLKGNLISFAIISGFVTLVFNILKLVFIYFFVYKKVQPQIDTTENEYNHETSFKTIIITGLRFFWIGIAAMIVWNTDNYVISNFLGIKDITPYAITFKLYTVCYTIIGMTNSSILPLMAKEFGNNNWEWINKIYTNFVMLMPILGGLTWLGGLLFFKDVIYIWSGKHGYAGVYTVFALGGYSYLLSMVNLNSGIINTFNYTKHSPWVGWLEAIVKLGFSIFLIKYWGIAGVAIGTLFGSLLGPTWVFPLWLVKRSNYKITFNYKFIIKHFLIIICPFLIIGLLIQIFTDNVLIRIISGILMCSCYCLLSYIFIPDKVKLFLWQQLMKIQKGFQPS